MSEEQDYGFLKKEKPALESGDADEQGAKTPPPEATLPDQRLRELKESEWPFLQLTENIQEVFWMTEPAAAKMIYVSPAYEKIWGRSASDLYQKTQGWLEFVVPQDADKVVASWEKQKQGIPTVELFRIERPDGTLRWIENRAYPVRDAEGDVIYVTGVAADVTESRQAEMELQKLAAQWQATFDAVTDSVCVLDADWTILQANKATMEILQLPMDRILGRKCYELVHGTTAPIDNCPVRRIQQIKRREIEELKIGKQWLEVTADPVIGADGSFRGAVHVIKDITERKLADMALRQSESTLKSIFRAAPTGIGMVRDRIITQANDRLCEMVGRSREELINKSSRILYPSEADYQFVGQEKYAQISQTGTGTVETRWQHKDGRILEVLLSSTPVNSEDLSEGVTFTALDITRRKQTEKALRNSHEMFLTVLESIDATIYVADMQTYEILFMNKRMRETFGGDLTGRLCWQVFRGSAGPCQDCSNEKLLDEAGKPTGVYVWQGKNPITGRQYINYDRAIEWIDGRCVRLQIATDITHLKRLEAQLQQSQKMEAIGNLAGGIAHDFNNILSAVIGYTELILDEVEAGSRIEKNLVEVHKAGLRARDLVKQILTFARQADQDLKPVKVSKIAAEVLKLLRSTLPASIAIESDIASDALVMADPTQIHQILMNICTNAAHAMEDDGGVLRVGLAEIQWSGHAAELSVALEPGNYLKLVISDTGTGIPEEHLPLIFEPYFSTKPTGEGTGLGLSVVHGIVKGCRGEILVESELGAGTIFSIFLPTIEQATEKEAHESENLSRGTERILFVDDERPICEINRSMLRRLGYQVTYRTSSLEALQLFQTRPRDFDVVITDMTMPNLNGDKLAAEIMKIRRDIPVILCTGYSKTIGDEKALKMGIKAFVMKPITISDLSKTIRAVLDVAGSPDVPSD